MDHPARERRDRKEGGGYNHETLKVIPAGVYPQVLQTAIVSEVDRTIKIWTRRKEDITRKHLKVIPTCLPPSPSDGRIVSGSGDKPLRYGPRKKEDITETLEGHTDLVRTLRPSDGRIVSGSDDKTIKIWTEKKEEGMTIKH